MQGRKNGVMLKIVAIFAAIVVIGLVVGLFFVPKELKSFYLIIAGLLLLNLLFVYYFARKNSRKR